MIAIRLWLRQDLPRARDRIASLVAVSLQRRGIVNKNNSE